MSRAKKGIPSSLSSSSSEMISGFVGAEPGYELLLVKWAFPPVQRSSPVCIFSLWTYLLCLLSLWSFPSGGFCRPSQLDRSGMGHDTWISHWVLESPVQSSFWPKKIRLRLRPVQTFPKTEKDWTRTAQDQDCSLFQSWSKLGFSWFRPVFDQVSNRI